MGQKAGHAAGLLQLVTGNASGEGTHELSSRRLLVDEGKSPGCRERLCRQKQAGIGHQREGMLSSMQNIRRHLLTGAALTPPPPWTEQI